MSQNMYKMGYSNRLSHLQEYCEKLGDQAALDTLKDTVVAAIMCPDTEDWGNGWVDAALDIVELL